MTTENIKLPELAKDASLKLTEQHNPMDVGFATQVKGDKARTKPPLDGVCVDHAMIVNSKNNAALRCLFIVLKGVDCDGNDLTGRDCTADLSFAGEGDDYTLATLRLMGFDFADVDAAADGLKRTGVNNYDDAVEALAKNPNNVQLKAAVAACDAADEAFKERLNDPSKSGGVGKKLLNLKFEQDEFKGTVYRRLTLSGITQPMAKLDVAATKAKFGGSIFKKLVASKDGPPKRDFDNKGTGGASQPRNPTSPPPVQSGPVKIDSEIPF